MLVAQFGNRNNFLWFSISLFRLSLLTSNLLNRFILQTTGIHAVKARKTRVKKNASANQIINFFLQTQVNTCQQNPFFFSFLLDIFSNHLKLTEKMNNCILFLSQLALTYLKSKGGDKNSRATSNWYDPKSNCKFLRDRKIWRYGCLRLTLLTSLSLTLNRFHRLRKCFRCWYWTSKYHLGN